MAELGEGLSGYLDVQDATLRAPRIEAVSNIGISNTAPQHAFSVGSNLYVSTDSSNVLTVDGNVVCEGVKVGLIEIIPSYDFAAVSNVGNVTQSTIQFSNATTAFVTTANIEVGTANLFVDTVTGRVGIGKTDPGAALDVVGDAEISSNLAVSGSKFTYDNTNTTVFTGTTSAAANEIGYLDMSTSSSSNNIHVKVYIKYGQSSALGDAEYSFYIRPNSANFSLIYDYRNQNGPITPVVYRTNANDLWSGGTPGVVRFGYSIASAQNVIWCVEVQQRSGSATFYPTNTGSAVDTTGLVQVTPAPFTRFDSNVAVSGNVGIGVTNPDGPLHISKSAPYNGDTGPGIIFTRYSNTYGGCIWNESNNDIDGLYFNAFNNTTASTAYGATPKMVINSNGNVGIGTTNPDRLLDVYTGTANYEGIQVRTGTTPAAFAKLITNAQVGGHNNIVLAGDLGIVFSPNNTASTPASNQGFYIAPWAGATSGIRINDNGRVGIGTTNPGETLAVNGSAVVTNGMYIHGSRYAANYAGEASSFYHPATITVNPANYNYTLTLEYACRAQAYVAYSDRRIKENIEDVDDASALEILRNLKPKKYTYKDSIKRGTTPVWGFIAQEVRETLPYATNLTVDYIPNIYELANVSQSNVITFTNFNTSNFENNPPTIRLVDKENNLQNVKVTSIIDEHSVSVEDDLSEWCGLYDEATSNVVSGDKIFVYGEEVSDFVSLNKDAIFTIATASVQELDRRLEAEKTKVASLEAQLASVLTRLDALESA